VAIEDFKEQLNTTVQESYNQQDSPQDLDIAKSVNVDSDVVSIKEEQFDSKKSKKKRKQNCKKFVDDGRVIFDMSILNFGGNGANIDKLTADSKTESATKDDHKITKKEKRAILKAGFIVFLPKILTIVLGFVLAMLLLTLWLR